jgi:hypothetical protein
MAAQAALVRRFPVLSDDLLANDARLAQTLADQEARAAQELEESDAQLARTLSKRNDDAEHRRSRMSNLIQFLPEDAPQAKPTRSRRRARLVEPLTAESLDRAALRLQSTLSFSAQHHHAVPASVAATASSSRSPPAADAGPNTDGVTFSENTPANHAHLGQTLTYQETRAAQRLEERGAQPTVHVLANQIRRVQTLLEDLFADVMPAQATSGQRFPALSDDVLADDARFAQTLADQEARAAQELEESDAQLARTLSEQDNHAEQHLSRMSDLSRIPPEEELEERDAQLSDHIIANDARFAQTLADQEARAAQELEESDAQLARTLSEQDNDVEQHLSSMSDLSQMPPEAIPVTRLTSPTRPVEPPAAESADTEARTALPLQSRLSAQNLHTVPASISVTASSSRIIPATDPGRQPNTDDAGLCVVCTDSRADTLLVDCR